MRGKVFIVVFVILLLLLPSFAVFAEEKVVLYSAHTQEIIDAMVPRLEAATGIKAEVVKMGSLCSPSAVRTCPTRTARVAGAQ